MRCERGATRNSPIPTATAWRVKYTTELGWLPWAVESPLFGGQWLSAWVSMPTVQAYTIRTRCTVKWSIRAKKKKISKEAVHGFNNYGMVAIQMPC
jgi:hypothetical protein